MKRCFFNSIDGSFVKSVESNHQETIDRNTPLDSLYFDGDYGPENYVSNEVVETVPEKPSELHTFDFQTKTWKVNPLAVRSKRASLLEQSDWADTLSAKLRLGEALYDQWQVYRQALRDLPEQIGFPEEVIWPGKP